MPHCVHKVEQVDEASGNAMAEVTIAVVEAILEPLRPAMVAMRAKVEVCVLLVKIVPYSLKVVTSLLGNVKPKSKRKYRVSLWGHRGMPFYCRCKPHLIAVLAAVVFCERAPGVERSRWGRQARLQRPPQSGVRDRDGSFRQPSHQECRI